jgi:hypothetical protein
MTGRKRVDLAGVDRIAPEKVQALSYLCQVGVRINHRVGVLTVAIPGAVDVVRHDVIIIHIWQHSFDIKTLEIP